MIASRVGCEVAYANRDGGEDVLHSLPHFRQPLVLERLSIAGLALEIWLASVFLDIRLIVGLRLDGRKAGTRVDRLAIGLCQ